MAHPETSSSLSSRASVVLEMSSNNLMWDVMRDLWCETTNPTGYINVGVAENMLMHDYILEFINRKLDLPAKYLTYNDGGGGSIRLKNAISAFLGHYFRPVVPVEPQHLLITNGVSSAIEHISWAFADPGEGILLGRPFYGTFIPDLSLRPGTTVVPVSFHDSDPLSIDAVGKYEHALLEFQQNTGKKVKGLMLCHPHNPLGRCYPRETLLELMKLCQKYQIHLISDEIYALSVWKNDIDQTPPPVEFESALSIDLTGIIDPHLVHVLWGMSKDFGANGLRLGVIISQGNQALQKALDGTSLYTYASGLSDHLVSMMLEDRNFTDSYLALNQQKLAESYNIAVQEIKQNGIEYAPGCNAAFFLWVNLGKKYCELHPGQEHGDGVSDKVMQVLLNRKVFLANGALFGSEQAGWFRIVFSHPVSYLQEALQRIILALHD